MRDRTTKQIAAILAEEYRKKSFDGNSYACLCIFIKYCEQCGFITEEEADKFSRHIHNWAQENKDNLDIYYDRVCKVSLYELDKYGVKGFYYWHPFDKVSRQKYLDSFNN